MINSIFNIYPKNNIIIKEWAEMLFDSFMKSFKLFNTKIFLDVWERIIFLAIADRLSLSSLQSLISCLRKNFISCNSDNKQRIFFEDQFHQARIMLEEATKKAAALQKIILAIREERLKMAIERFMDSSNFEELFNALYLELPKLGIDRCYLSLFENPKISLKYSRLFFAYNENRRIKLKDEGIVFSTKKLIPGSYYPKDRRFSLVIESLFFKDDLFGIILMELGSSIQTVSFYDTLSTRISSNLGLIMLINKTISQAQKLEIYNKKLQQSNQELQEFAYIASHDLQEPLRKISAFGERLKVKYDTLIDDQGRDYLERMLNASVRMQALITDLLAYSRVTTQVELYSAVDLSKIVDEVLSDLEILIEKISAKIEISPLPVIDADPTQMRQLFQNLIANALKFHKPNEPPVVKIFALKKQKDEYCSIVVEDNGIGIEEKYYDRIFGVFQRLHGKDEYEGSGIGLAVCKKIVERHGGTIKVESKLGKGTKFIISLYIKEINE